MSVVVSVVGNKSQTINCTSRTDGVVERTCTTAVPPATAPRVTGAHLPRQIIVSPLSSVTSQLLPMSSKGTPIPKTMIDKVLLKAVNKLDKKETKMFTLRGIDSQRVSSRDELKRTIKSQLQGDVRHDFDVGYVSGNSVISIRNKADISELWADVQKGTKVVLWCDGLSGSKGKQKRSLSVDDENESDEDHQEPGKKSVSKKKKRSLAQEEREEEVQNTIDQLKEKHGSTYTPMQVRIWSEMVVGGIHSSLDDPPVSSMFVRAGGGGPGKKKRDTSVSEALTQAAMAISSAISPRPAIQPSSMGTSPAKEIESRSKCYKQLSDLNALKASGILSEEEYLTEKDAVMSVLRKLKPL